jgi:chromosome partitioning protein
VIELVKKQLHPGLRLSGIVPCMYDSRMRLAREVLSELRRYFPEQVFRTPISANVKLAESPSFGKTIFEYAPDSIGARDFASLSHEVLTQEVRLRPVEPAATAPSVPKKRAPLVPLPPPRAPTPDAPTPGSTVARDPAPPTAEPRRAPRARAEPAHPAPTSPASASPAVAPQAPPLEPVSAPRRRTRSAGSQ